MAVTWMISRSVGKRSSCPAPPQRCCADHRAAPVEPLNAKGTVRLLSDRGGGSGWNDSRVGSTGAAAATTDISSLRMDCVGVRLNTHLCVCVCDYHGGVFIMTEDKDTVVDPNDPKKV